MKERYIREYGGAYMLESPNAGELERLFHRICSRHGIWHDNDQIFRYLSQFEQKEQLQLPGF